MFIDYKNKKPASSILSNIEHYTLSCINFEKDTKNLLIKGDNFKVLQSLLKTHANKIDLIYIDPPFATNNSFTIGNDRVSTISRSKNDPVAYEDNLVNEDFLDFLRIRLILLKELLSDNGSIYLHIDYKIGHYIKIIMDEVFGMENFCNDITRIKCNPKNFKRKAYGNIKDMILFYSKTNNHIWNDITENLSSKDLEILYKKIDSNGRRYTTIPLHAPGETNGVTGQVWRGMPPPKGRHWRTDPLIFEEWDKQGRIEWSKNGNPRKIVYADEHKGKKIQDIWEFKDSQKPVYPTEKNYNLLERIILNSSNENSIVLDCFCGSGTTVLAAAQNKRSWIGIDLSESAINVTKNKLTSNGFVYSYYELHS